MLMCRNSIDDTTLMLHWLSLLQFFVRPTF